MEQHESVVSQERVRQEMPIKGTVHEPHLTPRFWDSCKEAFGVIEENLQQTQDPNLS